MAQASIRASLAVRFLGCGCRLLEYSSDQLIGIERVNRCMKSYVDVVFRTATVDPARLSRPMDSQSQARQIIVMISLDPAVHGVRPSPIRFEHYRSTFSKPRDRLPHR